MRKDGRKEGLSSGLGVKGWERGWRCDILSGFGTFPAAAIINTLPTETSFGSGVNKCQSRSERRPPPSYSAAAAAARTRARTPRLAS